MIRFEPRLLTGLLALAPCVLGQGEPRAQELSYEASPKWDAELPIEVWHAVGARIDLAGHAFATRIDGQTLHVDTDADGSVDEKVRGATGYVALRHRASGYRYALRLRRVEARWEWTPSGALTGRVDGAHVQVVDMNGDGLHGSYGVDAMLVDRGPATWLSRIASIDGALVHFDLTDEEAARALATTRPYEGPVATLDARSAFESTGTLLSALFRDGEVCLDVAGARRGALVPAGTYRLAGGAVARGARTARIVPGRFEPIELEPGEERVLAWGGPLTAEFSFEVQGDQLTVHPNVRFYGRAGAEFVDFAPVVRPPKLFVEDAESGELVQYGRFGGCCGGGYSAWRATVPTGAALTVRLEHDRKLFGAIEGRGTRRTPQGGTPQDR